MTEFELIERFFKRRSRTAVLGNGDDCALVAPAPGNVFAITTDTLVAGRHFCLDHAWATRASGGACQSERSRSDGCCTSLRPAVADPARD